MVKNVANPPRISRPKVEPRAEILKNRSTLFPAGGAALGRSVTFCVSDMAILLATCVLGVRMLAGLFPR
ncbi:hypothetical protein GCM10011579_041160 [Streptomyces albiflavescens]|uniref:Uncharacterized protein n=1 Tax=Streptomyces albiflavescens TaxID=1623582 RepID=A0A917Y4H3_9ACTN|nr:hypothetical protein GCM10011579_041160 [Streptomyces albiflavescens]